MGVRSLRSSISLSLFVHAFFFLVCAVLLTQRTAVIRPPKLAWIDLTASSTPKRRSDQEQKIEQQIVQTSRGQDAVKPVPDAFLGERTQTVDRQTVSKERRITIGKSQSTASKPAQDHANPLTQKKDTPTIGSLSQLGMPILPHLKELSRSYETNQPQWVGQGQVAEDYVKGLKESEKTALNTREYVFFGYYQRIRERLDRAWVPILREKLLKHYRTGRRLASDMDHTTRVMVVLNPTGEITRVQIMSESGTAELDDAAIKAFNTAGPFPNPPKGIIDPDGEIKVPWEFILRT